MSSFLTKILTKAITKVIKDLTKFEVIIDDLIDKFKESCPPKDELLKIVQQKNQIQTALTTVTKSFNTVESTAQTTETLITTVGTAVKVIKAIPLPTSVPPGVGIPVNVITILADSLDTLGKLLDGAKGAVSVVPKAAKTISDSASIVLTKLQLLDGVLNKCIEDLAEGMTQSEKNDLITEIGNTAATAGDFENIDLNIANEDSLLAQLSPNSDNPFRYQRQPTIFIPFEDQTLLSADDIDRNGADYAVVNGKRGYYAGSDWLLTIEYNANNEYSFPQRRIRAVNTNTDKNNVFKGLTVFNIGTPVNPKSENGKYSYSTSVKVLIDEVKFNIDSLNLRYWSSQLVKSQLAEGINQAEEVGRDGQVPGNSSTTGNTTTTTTTSGNSNPPPAAITIVPTNVNQSLEAATTLELPFPIVGNNFTNSVRTVKVVTTVPSQSIKLTIDTGGNEIFNDYVQGDFGNAEFGSYLQGEVTVKSNTALGTISNRVISTTSRRELRTKTFTYNDIGEYTYRFQVTEIEDIQFGQGGVIKLETV